MTSEFFVSTPKKTAFVDITKEVQKIVKASSIKKGLCVVFVPHTTACVTINENADPSVRSDIINVLEEVIPEAGGYAHMEGNSPAHIKASIFGMSETILVEDNSLLLGIWQGIYFCEFDGPRRRKVIVKVIRE